MRKKRRKQGYIFFDETVVGPFQFLWSLPKLGFILDYNPRIKAIGMKEVEAIGHRPPWLIENITIDEEIRYPPLEHSDLHRQFAKLRPGPFDEDINLEKMKNFADRWGFLGHSKRLNHPQKTRQIYGESLGYWEAEINDMVFCLDLWDKVKYEQDNLLSNYVQWTQRPDGDQEYMLSYFPYSIKGQEIGRENLVIDRDKLFEYGNVIEPVRHFIHQIINQKLRKHVSPALFPSINSEIYLVPD